MIFPLIFAPINMIIFVSPHNATRTPQLLHFIPLQTKKSMSNTNIRDIANLKVGDIKELD
jgi:hypothetical protein